MDGRSPQKPTSKNGGDERANGETLAADQGSADTLIGSDAANVSSSANISVNPFPVADWDRYEFERLLGQGGMGAVYKARDRRLDRTVALKFIRGSDAKMTQRLLQEARAQARIDHPGICKVHEVGEVAGKAYIAMQFVDGKSLEADGAALSLTEKIVVVRRVAEAIHEAHRLGIIHRDIKPANIMIERALDGSLHPIVMDFGLARESDEGRGLTESGAVLGTPAYMAPEQARGARRTVDRRADVYSLGATLYDLIVGTPPFDAPSVVEVLLQVLSEEPRSLRSRVPSVPLDLETIVLKCLNKDPNQRYESAKALAEELARYMNGESILGRRVSSIGRLKRWAKRNRALFIVSTLSLAAVLGLGVIGLRQYLTNKRERELAQALGQEIAKMEWALRSARQLPLHDLGREKAIIRQQMAVLQTKLASYGSISRGLAHYALGRGHMALHEYPQALAELRQATQTDTADVHYALGFVLGKHFEQAMHEARLSGGGDWAKKQLKEIEPKYLTPAIASLQKSRAMQSDAPRYLEALIAYYQRDYDTAIKQAEAAYREAPWLYETMKLKGDIYLEQALQTRDRGRTEEAEKAFAEAVKSYKEAAQIGQSDAEVYEGLAEAWVRRIEMAATRGQPTETAYAAAVAAGDKITVAEPQSVDGHLKKAFAALMTMAISGAGLSSSERVKQCLLETQVVLEKQPENPYASDLAASCNAFAADGAQARGEDPEPLLRKGLALLEPAVRRNPHFLWGLNDLANVYAALGSYLQLHGKEGDRRLLEKALQYEAEATKLDATYLQGPQNLLFMLAKLVYSVLENNKLDSIAELSDKYFRNCILINDKFQQCYTNYLTVYARIANRIYLAGGDAQPKLTRAFETLAAARKLEGSFLDLEQSAALAHYIDAANRVRKHQDPAPALAALDGALKSCLMMAEQDATCRTLAAQREWVMSEVAAQQKQSVVASLQQALEKAAAATKSPEPYPDAWQVLAETHLRLSRLPETLAWARRDHLTAGLAATEKIFAINPNHAAGRVTEKMLREIAESSAAKR